VLRADFLEVKWQGHEADDQLPPYSDEVMKGGAIPPLPIHLHGIVLKLLSKGTI
jgi:hypothetical protein